LQGQLTELENSIASARQFYNDTVRRYNISIQQFPANAFAGSFGFSSMDYFEAPANKIDPPKASFL
jgi:LemA protein